MQHYAKYDYLNNMIQFLIQEHHKADQEQVCSMQSYHCITQVHQLSRQSHTT